MKWNLLLLIWAFLPLTAMAEQDDVKTAKAWVDAHAPDCTLTDGYACADVTEDDFVSRRSGRLSVPGNYLQAWQIALDDFNQLPDLELQYKSLKHYRIGFTESAEDYIVLFDALLLPRIDEHGNPESILTVTYGRSTKYWIDKKTLQIKKRLFLK